MYKLLLIATLTGGGVDMSVLETYEHKSDCDKGMFAAMLSLADGYVVGEPPKGLGVTSRCVNTLTETYKSAG